MNIRLFEERWANARLAAFYEAKVNSATSSLGRVRSHHAKCHGLVGYVPDSTTPLHCAGKTHEAAAPLDSDVLAPIALLRGIVQLSLRLTALGIVAAPETPSCDCAAASIDEEEGRSCVDHRTGALPVHFEHGDKGATEGPQWKHGLVFRSNLGKCALWFRHRQYLRATRRRQGCRHCGECPSEQHLSGRKKESHSCFSRPRPGPEEPAQKILF